MNTLEFAAERAARLEAADKEIAPFVEKALMGDVKASSTWADVIEGAQVLWLEIWERESGGTAPTDVLEAQMALFREMLSSSLVKTAAPSDPPTRGEIDRVTKWVGTVTVNDATWRSLTFTTTSRTKRWVTMKDAAVRVMHRAADGQITTTGGTFNVGGHRLHYPGEPVGPPEVWINCRCLLAPGNIRRAMSIMTDTMAVEPVVEEEPVDTELPEDPDEETEVDGEELIDDAVDDVPWHAVLAPEGVPTGDGRMFAPGALTARELPLPITYQYETAEGHMKAVVVGRMDEVWRDEASGTMRARGVFWMNEPMAHKAIDGIAQGFLGGLSVDVDNVEVEQTEGDPDAQLADMLDPNQVTVFSAARIAGASIVHIPAFAEAYIALGPDFEDDVELEPEEVEALTACGCIEGVSWVVGGDDEEDTSVEKGYNVTASSFTTTTTTNTFATGGLVFNTNTARIIGERGPETVIPFAPGTKDGPGWITHPRATARIRRYWVRGKGAAKIRWGAPGDFNRCRRQLAKYVQRPDWLAGLCANMHKEALGFWPAQHRVGRHSMIASATPAPMFTLVASGAPVEASYFKNPELDAPVGIVIDGDRIYGYVATWGVCHIGIPGKCEQAPHSLSNYAYFRTGTVHTDEGPIAVGSITMGTGHADTGANGKVAAAHYDNTGAVVADVATGEDTIGIWFSGKLRDNVTDEARYALAAAGRLSGDWRYIGKGLELVAALAVNVPGFPIPQPALVASAGEVTTVLSFGVVDVDEDEALVASALDAEMIAAISRTAVEEYIDQTEKRRVREERLAGLAPFREKVRQAAIDRLREQVKE